jgi:peptidyl-prolyl cis-trans isomerase SurA
MKSWIFVPAMAASLGAQQPTQPTPPAPAPRDTVISLDRIVAVVGVQPITQYDVQERLLQLQQQPGFQPPRSAEEFERVTRDVVGQLVDEELLVQKAEQLKVEIADTELTPVVERQLSEVRGRFSSDTEFRAELQRAGLGTPEEYRRFLQDQLRRNELQRRVIDKLRQEGKIPPVNVTEAEVEEAFNRSRATLPRRPATVTFRQIVIAPKPDSVSREIARVRAESLLAEIRSGAEFERVARRESADSISREQGGDLGWNRRGRMVPEFERWMFALRPGTMSPVIETVHGFHIIRVDRVQPGEVKSRHILVRPEIDSADVARARAEADSVARLWAAGAAFDTLTRRHHDFASGEETSILTPIPSDSGLPPSYREAFAGKKPNDIVTFQIPGLAGNPKYVVAQLNTVDPGGDYTLADLRERVRQQLVEEGSIRRFLDGLRKEMYVSIRLAAPPPAPAERH